MGYVSIFRRLSNAAIGRKGRFRMDTTYVPEHLLPIFPVYTTGRGNLISFLPPTLPPDSISYNSDRESFTSNGLNS